MAEARKRKSGLKRAAPKKRARKAAAGSRGLAPAECAFDSLDENTLEVKGRIEKEGGLVLAAYHEPLGSHAILFAVLPIGSVEPPPLEEVLKTMRERAARFNVDRIKQEDLASAGGPPDEAD
jgi:ParB family chromosome partitioning protein